jgi:hypothetical protein
MKNEYLIPDVIIGYVKKLQSATSANEKHNYTIQIEAIRDFCNSALVNQKKEKAYKKQDQTKVA